MIYFKGKQQWKWHSAPDGEHSPCGKNIRDAAHIREGRGNFIFDRDMCRVCLAAESRPPEVPDEERPVCDTCGYRYTVADIRDGKLNHSWHAELKRDPGPTGTSVGRRLKSRKLINSANWE